MSDFQWPDGQQCAVSLSYDDGLPVHHQHVAPTLEGAGIRGTFYTPGKSDLTQHPDAWRRVAAAGHELGNHSLFHPCRRELAFYPWLKAHYDLKHYTPDRFYDELSLANALLTLIDGQTERSYGNNCCHTTIGDGDDEIAMDDILSELVSAARGPHNDTMIDPRSPINFMQLGHFSADSRTCTELQALVEDARAAGSWIIFMLHGIGPETHKLNIDPAEHSAFVTWLGEQREAIWSAPIIDVVRHLRTPA